MLILITGILPSVAQQMKRERETEMLFRGRQIVDAVARYRLLLSRGGIQVGAPGPPQGGAPGVPIQPGTPVVGFGWPQSLEQLAEGIPLRGSTRRVRLLRSFALKDPMNKNAPWKGVGYNDPALREFLEAYFEASGQTLSMWVPQFRNQYLAVTIDLGDKDREKRDRPDSTKTRSAFGGVFSDDQNERTNFIFGAVSESTERPLRDYYGLERYDQWVFAFIQNLPPITTTGDQQIQMLTREIMFPSDPLAFTFTWGGGGQVVSPGGPRPQPKNPNQGKPK
jgi:hypothetical protein